MSVPVTSKTTSKLSNYVFQLESKLSSGQPRLSTVLFLIIVEYLGYNSPLLLR